MKSRAGCRDAARAQQRGAPGGHVAIEPAGWRLTTGFVGGGYLLPVLSASARRARLDR